MFTHFGHADCIVFLVDPLQVAAVADQLLGMVEVTSASLGDPLQVLANLVALQRRIDGARVVPMALTLSKFDALKEFGGIPASTLHHATSNLGAAYLRDPSMENWQCDADDHELLNAELQSLLATFAGVSLLNYAREAFPALRWFAVSALGHDPKVRIFRSGITPFRCLDPIKWVLARQGVIPTVRPREAG